MTFDTRDTLIARPLDDVLLFDANGPVSVRTAEARIQDLTSRLPATRYVMNLCTERHHFLIAFAAIVSADKTNLLPPNHQPDTLAELAKRYRDVGVVHDGDKEMSITGVETLATASVSTRSDSMQVGLRPDSSPDAEPERTNAIAGGSDARPSANVKVVAAISFTSGSTGVPRANNKTWEMLADGAGINAQAMFADAPEGMSLLATVPPQHMYGLELSVLLPMRMNLCVHVGQPLYPADVVAALKAMPSPRTLVTTPAHLRSLLAAPDDLPPVRRVFSATASLETTAAANAEKAFGGDLIEIYGCSEVGSIARRRSATESSWHVFDGLELVEAASISTDGSEFRIVAKHLSEAAELQDRLELRGPGRFQLLGRRDDLLNIAGKRGSLAEVNRRLLAIDGVIDGVVLQPDGGRLAAIVVAPSLNRRDIIHGLRQSLDPVFLPRPLVFVERLPRQASSKLRKADLLAVLESGYIDSAHSNQA